MRKARRSSLSSVKGTLALIGAPPGLILCRPRDDRLVDAKRALNWRERSPRGNRANRGPHRRAGGGGAGADQPGDVAHRSQGHTTDRQFWQLSLAGTEPSPQASRKRSGVERSYHAPQRTGAGRRRRAACVDRHSMPIFAGSAFDGTSAPLYALRRVLGPTSSRYKTIIVFPPEILWSSSRLWSFQSSPS